MFTLQNWRQYACWRRFALLSWSSFLVRLSNARSDPRRRLSFPVSVSPQFSHSSAPFSASARTLINREQINQSFLPRRRSINLAQVAYLRSFDRLKGLLLKKFKLDLFLSICSAFSWAFLVIGGLDLLIPLFLIGEELVDYGISS